MQRPQILMSRLLRCSVALTILLGATSSYCHAQTASVHGFVTDASNGEALFGVNVILKNETGDLRGSATDVDGIYNLTRIPPGQYAFQATYIGYVTYEDTLRLRANQRLTINLALNEDAEELDELLVQGDQQMGAAAVTAGLQVVNPQDIELIPTPDVSGDLASLLTALPGVVSLGDRGGQLFIRGGEPSHNLTLIDGMYVHQPYHILGFYSAFPSDIIQQADIATAGYGGPYSGRIASVIDVRSRNGNKRRFGGAASIAPFVSAARLEGPLIPNRVSFMGSLRQSVVEQIAQRYVPQDMPYTFGDAFAKIHAVLGRTSQLSISGLHTYDRGTIGLQSEDRILESVGWTNSAIGLRYVVLPRALPFVAEILLNYSHLYAEQGPPGEPVRWSRISGFNYAVNMTSFYKRTEWKQGLYWRAPEITSMLGGVFQDIDFGRSRRHKAGIYVEPDFYITSDLRARATFIVEIFPGQNNRTLFEPRVRLIWRRGIHEASFGAGRYHQEIFGINDRRDATNVFTAWRSAPTEDLSQAIHALLGYRIKAASWLEISTEGFYKDLRNLFVGEWSAYPRFTTRLQRADGTVVGLDVRAEVTRAGFYGYINYGLASVMYRAKEETVGLWFGTDRLDFRPPHDRRHQLNIVGNTNIRGFNVSVRWNFGSGRPFNRIFGFDGYVLLNGVTDLFSAQDNQRVIYERPFQGRLPTYHRLDVSIERRWEFSGYALALQVGAINLYDRKNLFALDIFTRQRNYQLPFVPTLGLRIEVD